MFERRKCEGMVKTLGGVVSYVVAAEEEIEEGKRKAESEKIPQLC